MKVKTADVTYIAPLGTDFLTYRLSYHSVFPVLTSPVWISQFCVPNITPTCKKDIAGESGKLGNGVKKIFRYTASLISSEEVFD